MQRPSDRLKKKIEKENLWVFILRILVRRRCYAFELRGMVQERFGFWIGTMTAYKVLYLLERGGYVQSVQEKRKKYYMITGDGKKELAAAQALLRKLSKV